MDTSFLAAYTFAAGTTLVVLFQLALAAGAPWAKVSFGGRWEGALPNAMRGVALMSAIVLVLFIVVVTSHAGLMTRPSWLPPWSIWLVVGYCAIGILANAATRSRWERIVWLPVVTLMAICSFWVAW